jgi:hypothetical protein
MAGARSGNRLATTRGGLCNSLLGIFFLFMFIIYVEEYRMDPCGEEKKYFLRIFAK